MAATTNLPRTPTDLGAAEFVEFCITEVLANLGAAECAADRLEPGMAFDVGCALQGAREALERAQTTIAQAYPQAEPQKLAA